MSGKQDRAAIEYDHGYDVEVFYLGPALDLERVERSAKRISRIH